MQVYVVCISYVYGINKKEHRVVGLRCGDEGRLCVSMGKEWDAIKRGLSPHYTYMQLVWLIDFNTAQYFESQEEELPSRRSQTKSPKGKKMILLVASGTKSWENLSRCLMTQKEGIAWKTLGSCCLSDATVDKKPLAQELFW